MNLFFKKIIRFIIFILVFISIAPIRSFAQESRPHVSESDGWEKIEAEYITCFPKDDRKVVWKKTEVTDSLGRRFPITLVLKTDRNNDAEVWADRGGVHYFESKTKNIKTPIDMSGSNYLFGPMVNYIVFSDPTFSYLLIRWHLSEMTKSKDIHVAYLALIDPNGKLIWKKNIELAKGRVVNNERVSSKGEVLIEIGTGDEADESEDYVEVWDRNGKKNAVLPKRVSDFYWSKDGESIHYTYYQTPSSKSNSASVVKTEIFDRNGKVK